VGGRGGTAIIQYAIFHEGKGHFTTREWAFFVFSDGKIIAIIK
jgi:hypothetical protein